MKKIYLFFLVILISCKTDNEQVVEPQPEEIERASVESFEPTLFAVGDTLALIGKRLDTSIPYDIKFGELSGELIDVEPNQANLIVPEGAVSGNLSYVDDEINDVIGAYQIYIKSTARLFAMRGAGEYHLPHLAEIDINTGKEIRLITSIGDFVQFYEQLRFAEAKNEVHGRMFKGGALTGKSGFFAIDVDREEFKFWGPCVDPDGYSVENFVIKDTLIYGYTTYGFDYEADKPRFEALNLGGDFFPSLFHEFEDIELSSTPLIYCEVTNEIIGRYKKVDSDEIGILRYNTDTKEEIRFITPENIDYKNLIITKSARLFGFDEQEETPRLVEINIDTGQEISTLVVLDKNLDYNYFQFSESSNEIVGLARSKDWPPSIQKLVKIDIDSGVVLDLHINPPSGVYNNLVLANVKKN